MLLSELATQTPPPEKIRRFHTIVILIAILVAVILWLQYTRFSILSQSKTAALWGVLFGVIGMGLLVSYRWRANSARIDNR